MQTHSNKSPHEQGAEATSTYRAYGGDIQPYPEPNNVAIENHQQQQKQFHHQQSHLDKSLRSNSNNFSLQLQLQQTQGQQKPLATPHLDSLKNTDFLTSNTKASITATTAARRYSRFENTEALERRVSSASSGSGGGGGGSRSLAASALADIITADVAGSPQQQQQQHTFGSRTYADGRIKRASIYGSDISGKLTAIGGAGSSRDNSGSLVKRHSGSFTGAFDLTSNRGQTGV